MTKLSVQKITSLLSKAKINPSLIVAEQGVKVVKGALREKFGYDFIDLAIKLLSWFAIAFLIEIYFKSKIAIDEVINDPDKAIPIISGLFGIGGIIFNLLFQQFKDKEADPDIPAPVSSTIFSNETIKKLFSDEGFHGFRFWDFVKMIAVVLVLMEWNRFRNVTKATGGQVSPFTHAIFLSFIIALGLTTVPDLIEKLKKTDFNIQSMR